MEKLIELINVIEDDKIIKAVFSSKKDNANEIEKIYARKVVSETKTFFQIEKLTKTQAFHENIEQSDIKKYLLDFCKDYKNINLFCSNATYSILVSKNNKSTIKTLPMQNVNIDTSHNKQKDYIICEGDKIEALVDLGVFTKDYKIVKDKMDKYKQINRFIEIINDEIKNEKKKSLTILDFGCGKSYLTFILYHYLTVIKQINVNVIGYDLKEEVVNNCNKIAKKYNYSNLNFYINDVSNGKLYDGKVDMVISLHACDTATDYTLEYAIKNKVKYIFSVPCCQHEINLQISKGGDFDIFLNHGLIKERFSALLTDAIRIEVLENNGYSVDALEFVDFSHSPKNLMIRGVLNKSKKEKNFEFLSKYNLHQKLISLIKE
ncbi:MAG: SAM-dependent methyltransferase [Clostridia bacterium]